MPSRLTRFAKPRTALTLGLGALVFSGGLWALTDHFKAPAASPTPAAGTGEIIARGRIEPAGRVLTLHGPTEGGVIQKILVEQGDSVAAGQTLAVLDGYDLRRADLTVAEGNLQLAEAQREQTVAGAKRSDVEAQRSALAAKKAQVVKLRAEWDRRSSLFQRKMVSQQSLDQIKAELEQAEHEAEQAANVLKSLTEFRSVDNTVALARIRVEKAAVEKARIQMEHMLVQAPVAGTILSIQARSGEAIAADGVLRMAAIDRPILAIAEVDEIEAPKVKEGMRAVIEGPILEKPVEGRVIRVAKEVFRQKRPSSDVLIGRDARIVEVEVQPDRPLPPLLGAEILVRMAPEAHPAK